MAHVSDLIRDSRLETYFRPDYRVETVHTYRESDPTGQRRVVNRSEHWTRLKKIGSGGFGDIWLERCTSGGQPDDNLRAVKQMTVDRKYGSIDYNRELEAIAKFSHKRYERCFVKSFGWYEDDDQLFIAMEYLEAGDLFSFFYRKPPLPEAEAKEIAYQILEGLDMLHDNGFAHRDLKPHNILIKSHPPKGWWIKIADFGISKRIEEGNLPFSTVRGTKGYIAPEIYGFVEKGSAYATDIWALGEIVFQLLTQKPTFKNVGLLANYIAQPDIFPRGELDNLDVSSLGIDFVLAVMSPRPEERLTAKLALSHEWIRGVKEPVNTPLKFDFPKSSSITSITENLDNPTEDQFAAWSTLSIRPKPENKIPEPIQRLIDALRRENFRLKMNFEAHSLGAVFSPDGSLLAITGPGPDVQIWRVEDGVLLYRLKGMRSPAFSPNGRYLAVLGTEKAWILLPKSGTLRKDLPLPGEEAKFIAFSPGSELLAAGGWCTKNRIKIWYSSTGEEYATFTPPARVPMGTESDDRDEMVALTFSSDGQRVLCATTFHTWSWDTAAGNVVDNPPTGEMGNPIKKQKGTFSLNGETLAFESHRIWGSIFTRKSSGGRMTRLNVCDGLIWAWTISPDGRVVVTLASEHQHKILGFWDTDSGKLLYSTSTTSECFIRGDWNNPFNNIKGLCFSTDSSVMAFFGPPGVKVGPCGEEDC